MRDEIEGKIKGGNAKNKADGKASGKTGMIFSRRAGIDGQDFARIAQGFLSSKSKRLGRPEHLGLGEIDGFASFANDEIDKISRPNFDATRYVLEELGTFVGGKPAGLLKGGKRSRNCCFDLGGIGQMVTARKRIVESIRDGGALRRSDPVAVD